MRIKDFVPGDQVSYPLKAIFVSCHLPHPLYPGLALVTWWLPDEQRWSLDALPPDTDLPEPNVDGSKRVENLRVALLKGQQR